MMKKLAIVTTHPIQYNAPVFRLLTERNNVKIKVFYTWGESVLKNKYDPGFGKIIQWDIPLLHGYDYSMVKNTSKDAGSHHFRGIVNPDLNKEIEHWGANAVLIYGWSFKSHLSCMKYFHGKIPVLFRGDSTLLDQGNNYFKDLARKLFLKYVYRHVDLFLYTGKSNKEYYLNAGVDIRKLIFAPHAIDNNRFSINTNRTLRAGLKMPDDNILFLYAGKFEKKKNVELLIDAFSKIENHNTRLLLAGNGPQEDELKAKVKGIEQSIQSRIHFMDFQNQSMMPDLYQSCDAFILPSKGPGETWGLSLNEAMASSKAVIASDKCGASIDLIFENENGFIFTSEDVHSLAEKMNVIIDNKNRLKEFGKRSHEIISSWSFENICLAIEKSIIN